MEKRCSLLRKSGLIRLTTTPEQMVSLEKLQRDKVSLASIFAITCFAFTEEIELYTERVWKKVFLT
jgi:hypothetical protein